MLGSAIMYFPQFLLGMFATSFIVAIWARMETGSIWQAIGWAILAAVVLQLGYMALVVRLIYKRPSKGIEAPVNSTPPLGGELETFRQRGNRARLGRGKNIKV